MCKTPRTFELLIILLLATGCYKFERNLRSGIHEAARTALETNEPANFDLNSITDFEWDSVLVVIGNESVPIFRDEIGDVLGQPANDLNTNRHRFYFVTPNNDLVIKELNAEQFRRPYISFESCVEDEGTALFWLTREECKFHVASNGRTLSDGTIYAFPNCPTKMNPNNFRIFQGNGESGR